MTDYKKKKQLIDENKDVYISEYDKSLSYEALSQIVDAKKSYADAAKAGDKQKMTESNNIANAVRAKYGNYTGGEFGNEYHPFVYAYDGANDYSSRYEDELDSLYNSIKNQRREFTYDYTKDPAYLAYKKVYDRQGALAYDRAMAENSLKTGGIENSNAQTAAMQALSYYNSQLAAKIPELYEAAYQRHYKEEESRLNNLLDAYELTGSREQRDYSRYLDDLEKSRDLRNFAYEKERDTRNFAYEQERDMLDRDYETSRSEAERELELALALNDANIKNRDMLYDLLRDSIDDEKWRVNHNLSAYKAAYPSYRGQIGTGSILDYARALFGNQSLTMEDLYNLLGL